MDPVQIYSFSTTSSLEIAQQESVQRRIDQEWIISVKDAAFPPDHQEWLKQYERAPNDPIRQSYRNAILQGQVDSSAPNIRVGIIFAEGKDKPSVSGTEMRNRSEEEVEQMTPEWRVSTAATLLRRFEIDDNVHINRPDNSDEILNGRHHGLPSSTPSSPSSIRTLPSRDSERRNGYVSPVQALIPRDIQSHTLTIDSDFVKLLQPGRPIGENFDILSTLIEVDLFSLTNLMSNFRQIIQSSGRIMSPSEIRKILDQMINDVRRLCIRSPRLFRMTTRSLIATSKDTRYGVNYGTVFATMMTSAGIRRLLQKSGQYYLSLNDEQADQRDIRPPFLQMLILLLSFLNNDDLQKSKDLLENTFELPSTREDLELVIMKVLPLESIDPGVFLTAFRNTYNPMNYIQGSLKIQDNPHLWNDIRLDLAKRGYLLPYQIEDFGSSTTEFDFDEDLEDGFERELNGWGDNNSYGASTNPTWFPPWPKENGIKDSMIFRFLQHFVPPNKEGTKDRGIYRGLNDVPHLEIKPEDKLFEVQAIFSNGSQYRIANSDPEPISQMEKNIYVLKSIDNSGSLSSLIIDNETLNTAFIEAAKHLNKLIHNIQLLTGFKESKRFGLPSNRSGLMSLAEIDIPVEAKRVTARITSDPSDNIGELCAEAFKLGNRVVYRTDVARDMNTFLTKMKSIVRKIDSELQKYQVKRVADERARNQQATVQQLHTELDVVKVYLEEGKIQRSELIQSQDTLPSDPINKIIYSSFEQVDHIEFAHYTSQLSRDEKYLFLQCRILYNTNLPQRGSIPILLEFDNYLLSMTVVPLLAPSSMNDPNKLPVITERSTFLWLGYYLLMVRDVDPGQKIYEVGAWLRIVQLRHERDARGIRPVLDKPQRLKLV